MPKLVSIAGILKDLAKQQPQLDKSLKQNLLKSRWAHVVGEKLAEKTEPDRVVGRILWIRTSHPAWGQELQFYQSTIIKNLSELDGRLARVSEIRFFQGTKAVDSELDSSSAASTQPCKQCGFLSSGELCALCRNQTEDQYRARVYRFIRSKPWLAWDEFHGEAKGAASTVTRTYFSEIRRQVLYQLRDELTQWAFEFKVLPPGVTQRQKSQKTACLYATIKLSCKPEELKEKDLKGALGRWRYELIFNKPKAV